MPIQQQNPDGSWSEARPIPLGGWKAKTEEWMHKRGLHRLGRLMGRWDERGLG